MTLKVGAVTCLAFAPDGKTLATASGDGTVKLWRAAKDQEATAFRNELDPDDPESPVAVNGLGDRHRQTQRPRQAEEAYKKALVRLEKLAAAFRDTPEYRCELAYCLLAPSLLTDPPPAAAQSERRFAEIWRTLPADQRSRLGSRLWDEGRELRAGGHFQEALRVLSKAIDLNPEHERAYHDRAHAYEGLKEWDRALADFAEAMRISPMNSQNYVCRAGSFELRGQPENAARDYTQLIELKADSPLAWYKLALFALQRGDHAGYRKLCSRMLERFDEFAGVDDASWATWTCVLAPDAVADWTKPLKFAEKVHAADGTNYDKLNHLGAVLYRSGRFPEAARRLTEAEAVFKQAPIAGSTIVYNWFFQAMARHRLGHTAEAAGWLKKAVEAIDEPSPKTAQAPATIPWNRRLTSQLLRREAEELLKNPADLSLPADRQLLIARGRFHAECGEHQKADADFARAASLAADELNGFLEAGWWVAGPFPADLKTACPPERDPDPSRPIAAVGSATPLSWRSVSADTHGIGRFPRRVCQPPTQLGLCLELRVRKRGAHGLATRRRQPRRPRLAQRSIGL